MARIGIALVLVAGLAALGGGCRRVGPSSGAAAPPRDAAAALPAPPAASAPASVPVSATVAELYEVRRRLADAEARLRALEAAAPPATDAGLPVRAGRAGPPGPTGPTGPPGPAGPAVRLDAAPAKGEVYHRRAEQPLEPGETGAAVARCAAAADALVGGSCAVVPGPVGILTQVGAYGLDDARAPAGWRCEYRNASRQRAIRVRADVYCVSRRGARAAR